MNKPFNIPDDPDSEESDIPRYFQPGKILENIEQIKKIECSKGGEASFASSEEAHKSESISSVPGSSNTPAKIVECHVSSGASTKFGSAFSSLKSSKYFEEENEVKLAEKSLKVTGALLVNPRQRGNPLLKHIRSVPWEFVEMEPDYVMGRTSCALFLSMRYHNLFPNYIHERLKALGKSYELRVLLIQVDVVEPSQALKDLSVIAILADCTLLVCWSAEEAGNYLETYKMFENKSSDLIKERPLDDNFYQVIDCLTCVKSINKTDAAVLLSSFGTLAKIFQASTSELAICPGIGPLKAKRLYDALHKPVTIEKKQKT